MQHTTATTYKLLCAQAPHKPLTLLMQPPESFLLLLRAATSLLAQAVLIRVDHAQAKVKQLEGWLGSPSCLRCSAASGSSTIPSWCCWSSCRAVPHCRIQAWLKMCCRRGQLLLLLCPAVVCGNALLTMELAVSPVLLLRM